MGKKDAATQGLSKKERKALEEQEAAIMAELEARSAKIERKRKTKGKALPEDANDSNERDLTTLKRKALKTLIADKTNGALRKAAKAELKRRDAGEIDIAAEAAKAYAATSPEQDAADVKAARKAEAAKPVKPAKPAHKRDLRPTIVPEDELAGVQAVTHSPAAIVEAADKVLADPNASEGALKSARAARSKALEAMSPEDLKARVQEKALARKALTAEAASVDRSDADAVAAYNAKMDALGGGKFITSDAERETRAAGLAQSTEEGAAIINAALEGDVTIDIEDLPGSEPAAQEVDEVETEEGRVFAAGEPGPSVTANPADDRGFALPSEGVAADFEVNGNGQYKIKRLSDGKIVGYTRATTYIGTNEDKTLLEKWKMRILLEGVALNDTPDDDGKMAEPVVGVIRQLIHVRDVTIAKARKADRKGKLVPGQFGTINDGAWSEFKRELDKLADNLLELGGVHVKAEKGTELHELTELYDREGIDAVGDLAAEGKITHADLADVEAYARAVEAAGIKIIPEFIEQPIVVEELKVAGRLDRVVMAKLPGAARAARYIFDVKSGRIDLGAGKIAQQLEMYSRGETYDLETHDRGKHGASRTKGLVLHLVPGSGEAHIYVIDLGTGRVGNELSAKVRAFRNDGKRAIDRTVDLAKPGTP